MTAQSNKRYTISISHNLHDVIEARAELNCRSINGEITFLLECALAAEIDTNQEILRMLMKAGGGPTLPPKD